MFANTLTLVGTGTPVNTSIIDGPTNGKTVRSSADGVIEVSIAHQESNENPGYDNRRSNVRITKLIEVSDTGKFVKAYAQFTLSIPHGVVDATVSAQITAQLVNFLVQAETASSEDADYVEAADFDSIPRLYAGEP
jgi:hypothetical protein